MLFLDMDGGCYAAVPALGAQLENQIPAFESQGMPRYRYSRLPTRGV
jgi:hypothetical protein